MYNNKGWSPKHRPLGMNRKEWISCGRKRNYSSFEEAREAQIKILSMFPPQAPERLEVYECHFHPGHYHVGHRKVA